MITRDERRQYYQALLERNSAYEGLFFVGVKTTGIFCRPTCPARKPKFSHCEFFKSASAALMAAYRPCQRCRPLAQPGVSSIVAQLLAMMASDPTKRWNNNELCKHGIDPSTARRHFKKRFNMTFIEYVRSKRIATAVRHIKAGSSIIDAQLASGYESSSGFRAALTAIIGVAPTCVGSNRVLQATWIDTLLGPMMAIADDDGLYLLEFIDQRGLKREIKRLRDMMQAVIVPGETMITQQIKVETCQYFAGNRLKFATPIHMLGTAFQLKVWRALQAIPFGNTRSYLAIAKSIGAPSACRAVARANGANRLTIIIPCHRVINANGNSGGYAGGISRKQWLLDHENSVGKK